MMQIYKNIRYLATFIACFFSLQRADNGGSKPLKQPILTFKPSSEPINHKYNTFVHIWLKKYNSDVYIKNSSPRSALPSEGKRNEPKISR